MPQQPAQPTPVVVDFVGVEGAEQLSRTGTKFTPLGSGLFRARVHSISLNRTRIVSFTVTPTRGDLRSNVGAMHPDLVFFTFLLAGRAIETHDGRRKVNTPGSIRFVRVESPYHYVAEQAVHNVSWWLTLDQLQPEVASALRRVTAMEFRNDATARSATAVIGSIVAAAPEAGSDAAASLERVLIAHVEAVVMAAETWRLDPDYAHRSVYHEVRELIAANLARTDISLPRVAAELDITPGLLSRALIAQGATLRGELASQRLDRLAELLRDAKFRGNLTDAATTAGYGGTTQAARAFRTRFSVTMNQYRTLHLGQ